VTRESVLDVVAVRIAMEAQLSGLIPGQGKGHGRRRKVKRASLFALLAWVVGLLAGPASAGMFTFTLNHDAAMMLTEISHDPTGSKIYSKLYPVTDDPAEYDSTAGMRGVVGYVGLLDAAKSPKDAWMRIGANATTTPKDAGDVIGAVLGGHTHDLTGYGTYNLFLANDDNSDWWVRLFIDTGSDPVRESGSKLLHPGDTTTLSLDLTGLGLSHVTAIGFDIGGLLNNVVPNPSDPDFFHVSAVPVPAGVLLGFLGLSAAGLGLRKLAVRTGL
jgi:hypothetical protein